MEGSSAGTTPDAGTVAELPRPCIDDVWPTRREVPIDALVGTPEWLDALDALGHEERVAAGVTFKVYDATRGQPEFLADWGSRVPTATALQQHYPRGGVFLVRPVKRRTGRGGGNLAEVRVAIRGAGSGEGGGGLSQRDLLELARDAMAGRLAPKSDAPSKGELSTLVGEAVQAQLALLAGEVAGIVKPYVPLLKQAAERMQKDDGTNIVQVLKDTGLLAAIRDRVAGTPAKPEGS